MGIGSGGYTVRRSRTVGAGGGKVSTGRCEIALALTYAFWEYPAIRETLDEHCSEGAELHARLARACTVGEGRRTSVHDYWLCPEHAELIPVLDEVVRRTGDEPRLLGFTPMRGAARSEGLAT